MDIFWGILFLYSMYPQTHRQSRVRPDEEDVLVCQWVCRCCIVEMCSQKTFGQFFHRVLLSLMYSAGEWTTVIKNIPTHRVLIYSLLWYGWCNMRKVSRPCLAWGQVVFIIIALLMHVFLMSSQMEAIPVAERPNYSDWLTHPLERLIGVVNSLVTGLHE